MKMKRRFPVIKVFLLILFVVALIQSIVMIANKKNYIETISEESVNFELIEAAQESNNEYVIRLTDGSSYKVIPSSSKDFAQVLFTKEIPVDHVANLKDTELPIFSYIKVVGIVVIAIAIIIVILIGTGILSIGRIQAGQGMGGDINEILKASRPDTSIKPKKEIPDITFKDIEGCAELKRDAQGLINYLKNPYKYEAAGARMPKGVILYGPPGTGKTLTAKAIAGEAGVPFLSVSGSDFVEMYVGVGAKRVRELFEEANKNAPCIIFIDEIDAIAGKRGASQNSERDQTINAILTEMDGFSSNKGVMILAATNRLDMLDSAILRPGRFDKHLAVPLPNKEEREAILKLHAKNKKLDESVDLKVLAAQTTGFAGAGLESLLNEATLLAVNAGKKFVSQSEIDKAFFKVVMEGDVKDGQDKRGSKELELVAWHEAGHTLITKLLTNDEVSKVTILASTSGAGGVTFHNPKEGEFFSKKDLQNRIAIAYGGRAAEEILFGDHDHVTVGASSDIQQASQQIKDYIMKYGMSEKFGMLDISAFDYQSMSNDDIVNEASKIANEIYAYTLKTLNDNVDALKRIAEALLERETLLDEEVVKLINGEPLNAPIKDVEETENNSEEYHQMTIDEFLQTN